MQLGAFSLSLTVKDLQVSLAFYEKLGFSIIEGDASEKWLVLRNGDAVVGLFEGMFDRNMLTFNPGWNSACEPLESFTDVRDLQKQLREQGIELADEADESGSGPASLMVVDPDGNPILIDQHV